MTSPSLASPAEKQTEQQPSPQPTTVLEAPDCKTKGEKLYDTMLYGGVGYGLNLVLSVIGGHFFLKGKGRRFFDQTEKTMHDAAIKALPEKYAKIFSREFMRIIALGAGGHLVMLPTKLLEDNKKRFVYWINSRFFPAEYEKAGIEIKPLSEMTDDKLPETVETPARMSWTKTALRRTAIFFGIPLILAPFGKLNNKLEEKIFSGVNKSAAAAAKMSQSQTLQRWQESKTFRDYLEVGSSDVYVSGIAAVLMKLTNGAHGLFSTKKKVKETSAAAPQDLPAAAAGDRPDDSLGGDGETAVHRSRIDRKPPASHVESIAPRHAADDTAGMSLR